MSIAQLATSREAIAVYMLVIAGIEKKFQFIRPVARFVKNHPGIIVTTENAAKAIGESVAGKVVETKLHAELDSVMTDLKKSSLAQYALAVIQGAGKAWNELSPAEQGAAIAFVQKHLPSSVEATEKEIAKAFQDSPQLAQMFVGDAAYVKAQELTALLSKATAQEPSSDTANSTPNSPTSDGQAPQPAVS